LYQVILPFVDPVTKKPKATEQVIHEVLSTLTIPEFSEFVKNEVTGTCHIKDLKCIDARQAIYLLPAYLTYCPVKSVIDVRLPFRNDRGLLGYDVAPSLGIPITGQSVIASQGAMMLAGEMRNEPTFKYLGNNKIQLFGFPKVIVEFVLGCEHDPNGESIPETCYDSFMELADLDVKDFCWNTLRFYDELPTAFGTIKIQPSQWEGAEDKRKTLLDEWRDKFHVDEESNWKFM
jgi:hypothetical protein